MISAKTCALLFGLLAISAAAMAGEYDPALADKTRAVAQGVEISAYKEQPYRVPGLGKPVGLDVSFTLTQTAEPSQEPVLLYLYPYSKTNQNGNRDLNCQTFDVFPSRIDGFYQFQPGQKTVRAHYRCLPWNVHLEDESGGKLCHTPQASDAIVLQDRETLSFSLYLQKRALGPNSQDLTGKLLAQIPPGAKLLDSAFWRNNLEGVKPAALKAAGYGLCNAGESCYCRLPEGAKEKAASIQISGYTEQPETAPGDSVPTALTVRFHVRHLTADVAWLNMEPVRSPGPQPILACRPSALPADPHFVVNDGSYRFAGIDEGEVSYRCTTGLRVIDFTDKEGHRAQRFLPVRKESDAPQFALELHDTPALEGGSWVDVTDHLTGAMPADAKFLSLDFWEQAIAHLEVLHPIDNAKLAQKQDEDMAAAAEQEKHVMAHLKLAKQRFIQGEPIGLTLTISNQSAQEITFGASDYPFWYGGRGIKFGAERTSLEIKPDEDCWGCFSHVVGMNIIGPGETWVTTIYLQDFLLKPPVPGDYAITYAMHLDLEAHSHARLKNEKHGSLSFAIAPGTKETLAKLYLDAEKEELAISRKRENEKEVKVMAQLMEAERAPQAAMAILTKSLDGPAFIALASQHGPEARLALRTLGRFPQTPETLAVVLDSLDAANVLRIQSAIQVLEVWHYPLDKARAVRLVKRLQNGSAAGDVEHYLQNIRLCSPNVACRCSQGIVCE